MRQRSLITLSVGRSAALLKAVVVFCALLAACGPQAPRPTTNIVRQIDHILIVSSEAKELFALLSGTFQLPVAWPMADYGSFASGGVAVGNVNLEIIQDSAPAAGTVKSRWTGFALEPEPLRISLAELDARGIRHGAAAPFRSQLFTTRWTTVGLPEVSSESVEVFLCQFEDDLPCGDVVHWSSCSRAPEDRSGFIRSARLCTAPEM